MASSKTTARALASIGQGITAGVSGYLNFSELQLRRDQAQQQADMFAERKAALEQERQAMAQKQQFAAQHAYFKTIGDFASMSPEAQKAQAPKYLERVNQFAQQGGFNVFESPDELVNDMKVNDVSKSFRDFASAKNAIAAALAGGTMTPDQFQSQYKVAAESIDKLANFYAFDEGDAKQFRNMRQELDQAAKTIGDRFNQRLLKDKEIAAATAREGRKDEKGYKLTAGEIESISNFDASLANLSRLQELKRGVDTGVIPSGLNTLAKKVGIDNPKSSTARSQMKAYVSDAVRAISGAAASDQERAFLTEQVPNANDDDDTFEAKLAETMRRVQMIRDTRVNALKMAGKGVDQFIGKSAAPTAPASPSAKGGALVDDFDLKF